MNRIFNPSDAVAVVATIDPQAVDNATYTSDWVDMGKFSQVMFIGLQGAADIAVNAKVQSASDSSGSGAADITGLAIVAQGGSDDNEQWIICVREDQLPAGHTHVALVVAVADGTTNLFAAVALGFGSNYLPASEYDLSSVAQIITA